MFLTLVGTLINRPLEIAMGFSNQMGHPMIYAKHMNENQLKIVTVAA